MLFNFPIVAEFTLKCPLELATPWENFILIFKFFASLTTELSESVLTSTTCGSIPFFLANLEERIAKETKSIFDFSYKFKIGIAFASSLGILLVIILNNYSIKEDIAITKNIQTDSFAKAEEKDTIQNNHFSIKQVKGNK